MTEGIFPKVDGNILFASDANQGTGVVLLTAGENVTAGNAVYIKATDGMVYVSDSATQADVKNFNGICLTTALTGATTSVMTRGVFKTTGLTANTFYYVGAAGAFSTTGRILIGLALSTTALIVNVPEFKVRPEILAEGGLTIPTATLSPDTTFFEYTFHAGQLSEFDVLQIDLAVYNNQGASRSMNTRLKLSGTVSNPNSQTIGLSVGDNSFGHCRFILAQSQRVSATDSVGVESQHIQTFASTSLNSEISRLVTGTAAVFATAWTLRISGWWAGGAVPPPAVETLTYKLVKL